MTPTLFISLFSIGSILVGLITEAIKVWYRNAGKKASPNVIALIDAIVVGGVGTAIAYALLGIAFTVNNILCIVLMVVTVWHSAMLGYDKIVQTLTQVIDKLPPVKDENKE